MFVLSSSICTVVSHAQALPGTVPPQSTGASPATDDSGASITPLDSGDDAASAADDTATARSSQQPRPPLSAEQIIAILQQNPDVVAELKLQLAERMQQQGIDIDAGDISDEMLYRQITTNADLRTNVSMMLRARGYVSDEESLNALGSSTIDTMTASQSESQGNGAVNPGLESRGRGSARRMTSIQSTPSIGGPQSQQESAPRHEKANASTDEPAVVHQAAPYDLQSLRDLYAQIPDDKGKLKRFGSDVFINRMSSATGRGISTRDTPLDVPLGPDYVLGAGDTLTIHLWGGATQTITRTIDRDGTIFLPEAGSLQIAGMTLEKAQALLGTALKGQFRDAHFTIIVSGLRSVRVYVVGDVQRPGGYDISSLATPISALFAAGGPTAIGSLRILIHYRGEQLIESVDLYDFLLHGMRTEGAHFQSGDTLLVPPAGPLVAVSGAIKRPAIYELKATDTSLAKVIADAGGFTAAASLVHIRIERIDANRQRETVTLGDAAQTSQPADAAIAAFEVKDGDRIHVDPILPYSQRAIYLAGHVVRPGRLAYKDGMRLSDVLHSYQDMLPEPAAHGEIVRLVSPDLHAETIDFSVPDVLIGNANVDLRPFDTIHVFGRYQIDAPIVTVLGEVLRPGKYPLSQGMSAAQLVRMAGGFKRDALQERADLTSYDVKNGNQIVEDLSTVQIGAAISGADPKADVLLKPGDILSIHEISNWNDIGESVTIRGQVRYPGSYGFHDGERLSSVLLRAGGLLPTAYPLGAVLIRDQVKELEQKSRDELIRQIETSSASARLSPGVSGASGGGALQLIKEQQNQVITDLKNHPPSGRMVIHINADIQNWANTPADIELRRGDELMIPKRPGFVLVSGQVYNATALTFTPGKTAAWYLRNAGGTNGTANRKEIFVIRANGTVVGRRSGTWFEGDVLSTRLNPGDVIVVPQKIIGGSLFWRNLLSAGQLAGSVALTAGVAAATL